MNVLSKRPTEALTGPALGAAVFGWLTDRHAPVAVAIAAGALAAFGPALVSQIVDALRKGKR